MLEMTFLFEMYQSQLVQALCVRELVSSSAGGACAGVCPSLRPVVLHSFHEHHSNILPWREAGAIVVEVSETETEPTYVTQQLMY